MQEQGITYMTIKIQYSQFTKPSIFHCKITNGVDSLFKHDEIELVLLMIRNVIYVNIYVDIGRRSLI